MAVIKLLFLAGDSAFCLYTCCRWHHTFNSQNDHILYNLTVITIKWKNNVIMITCPLFYSAFFMWFCFPPNYHFSCFTSSRHFTYFNDPSLSFRPIAPCPLISDSHSHRHVGSRLRGVLFVIGSDDLHVPPWHILYRVNYSLRGNYTCVPRESPRQPAGRKKRVYYHGGAKWWISCSLVECR